jgi:predicted outer membrane repeat protein
MGDGKWFRRGRRPGSGRTQAGGALSRGAAKRGRGASGPSSRRAMHVEQLEDRRMLATFTVVTLGDTELDDDDMRVNVEGGLRWAVAQAEENDEADIIVFADGLVGNINLNQGQIAITDDLRILGPSPQKITINADSGSRIFNIDDDQDDLRISVEISGVSLTGGTAVGEGDDAKGGAIFSVESLRMTEVIVANNTAAEGGGAIFQDQGDLRIWRSLFLGNESGGIGGGAILIGVNDPEAETRTPEFEIKNSTLTGNAATSEDEGESYGGAIMQLRGKTTIISCTITDNKAATGGGVASFGDPPSEDPEEEGPSVNEMTVISTILWANEGGDLNDVGMTDPEDEEEDPEPLAPIIESLGYNIIGDTTVTLAATDLMDDPLFVAGQDGPELIDVGGVLPVFYLQPESPAIDAGDPEADEDDFEQRGRHFTRVYGYVDPEAPIADIGAVEVQVGNFIVDSAVDESDLQYSSVGTGDDPYTAGDFSLREALLFSELNPEIDHVGFSGGGTISLTLGELPVFSSVFIDGPTNSFVTVSGINSSRIFNIDNGVDTIANDISISNLVLANGRSTGQGGAIFNRENLTLNGMTIRNSTATVRGGAVFTELGELTVIGSTINNNNAADDGAGIYLNGVAGPMTATIIQSTISGNRASDRGAGITNNSAHLIVKYSTITNNKSDSTLASGIGNMGATAVTELRSTIVSGNINNDLGASSLATAATFVSLDFNLIGNGVGFTQFTMPGDQRGVLNPLLGPLAVTGGRVATHRPAAGSPAIDRGDPEAVAATGDVPEFDQRGEGFTRVFDGDEDGTDRIDVGAYELQASMLVVDNDGDAIDGNLGAGQVTLREAINLANQNPIPDVIVFDISSDNLGPVISAASELAVTDSVKILGPGSGILAIVGGGSNLFTIDNGLATLLDVEVSGLEMRNGTNGAVISRENLALDDILFAGNSSPTAGGAIFHELGMLKLNNSLITGSATTGINADGGAIYIRNAVAEITGYTTIAGNYTSGTNSDGGAIAIKNSTLTASQITISGNTTPGGSTRGGGIFIDNSTVFFEEAVISGNSTRGSNSQGGGIAAVNSQVTLEKNSLVAINSTVGSQAPGGGIFMSGGTLLVNNGTIIQNTTAGLSSSGGGIALQGGAVATIAGTTMLENTVAGVGSDGGAVSNVAGTLIVRNSLLVGNQALHAQAKGGAVYSDTNLSGTQSTLILNSTISGNSAGLRGGGVFNADGRLEIRHATITNNSTPYLNAGNGVASQGNAATLTVVQSSLIAGNVGTSATPAAGSDVDFVDSSFINSIQSLGYNVIGTGNVLSSFTQPGDKTGIIDPLLGPLSDNGGPTRTHALLAGSPAINAGSPSFNPNAFTPPLTADQRGVGFPRVLGGRIDAGAFESSFSGFTADFDGDGRVDGGDFLRWQRGVGTPNATKSDGDANGDGAVNGADLGSWKSQFGSTASEAAAAPAAVSGGSETPTPAAAPAQAPAAQEIALVDYTPLAAAGTPTAASSTRTGYRPPVEPREVVTASRSAAFAAWTPAAASNGDDDAEQFDPEAGDPDLSGEDAVFALLGDGVL